MTDNRKPWLNQTEILIVVIAAILLSLVLYALATLRDPKFDMPGLPREEPEWKDELFPGGKIIPPDDDRSNSDRP
jgi:hypothetical protein